MRVAALFSSTGEDEVERRATQGAAAVPKPLFEASVVETLGLMLAGASDGQDAAVITTPPDAPTDAQLAMADPKLTSRQREALLLVSQGHSNREIARILGIAKGTVKVHVNAAFRCLGVHNRVNAAAAFRKYFEIH